VQLPPPGASPGAVRRANPGRRTRVAAQGVSSARNSCVRADQGGGERAGGVRAWRTGGRKGKRPPRCRRPIPGRRLAGSTAEQPPTRLPPRSWGSTTGAAGQALAGPSDYDSAGEVRASGRAGPDRGGPIGSLSPRGWGVEPQIPRGANVAGVCLLSLGRRDRRSRDSIRIAQRGIETWQAIRELNRHSGAYDG
jgi:hypothetical protein